MDWANAFQDAGVIAGVSTAIFFLIDFLKKVFYKLPWKWVQKTPGEVWFALSMILGIGVAIGVFWPDFKEVFLGQASPFDKIGTLVSGLVFGAGSKVVHAVATPAGAKLQTFKLEQKAKADALTGGTGYIAQGTGASALINASTPTIVEQECATPAPPVEIPLTATIVERQQLKPEIIFVKSTSGKDYLLVNGKRFEISMQVLELTNDE